MAGFRDAVGRFRGRQAQASEASEAIEAGDAPPSRNWPRSRMIRCRSRRPACTLCSARRANGGKSCSGSGNVEAVIVVDSEITRLVVGLEAAQARIDADYAEAPARERARLLDLWQRVHGPRLETARARRDKAAVELCQAIGDCAVVENEVAGIANALGYSVEISPVEGPLTTYLLQNWIRAHQQRVGQAPPRAA